MPISRQTIVLADRLQRSSDRPLTQRQAIRCAVWHQEEARALQEQLADYHRQQTQQPDCPDRSDRRPLLTPVSTMIYRFINLLPRTWRYRSQRVWMHTRDIRDLLWLQSPRRLLEGAFVVPFVGLVLLWILVRLAPLLAALLLVYGLFLAALSVARAIALVLSSY